VLFGLRFDLFFVHVFGLQVIQALEPLNLRTISPVRRFFSKECLDVLSYSSEGHAAAIDAVAHINTATDAFLNHNPGFTGSFHLIGHGIGGCLLLNILSPQAEAAAAPGSGSGTEDVADSGDDPAAAAAADAAAERAEAEADARAEAEEAAAAQAAASVDLPSLEDFFERVGLGEFVPKLKEEEVTMETLLECADSDYSELGFKLGQRKRVMKDLGVLRERRESVAKIAEQQAADAEARAASRALERRRRAAERAEARAARQLSLLAAAESRPRELVPRPSCPSLHRPPACCFLFGAPVGFFSALDVPGARLVGPDTELVGRCELYNVFHPCVNRHSSLRAAVAFVHYSSPRCLPSLQSRLRMVRSRTRHARSAHRTARVCTAPAHMYPPPPPHPTHTHAHTHTYTLHALLA
jgi:hypothetical protein